MCTDNLQGPDQIASFWNWFARNESLIRATDSSAMLKLDKMLTEEFQFGWELAPMPDGTLQLMVSVGGDLIRKREVENFVLKAPKVSGWLFTPFRRRWDLRHGIDLADIDIGGSKIASAKGVILKHSDACLELLVWPPPELENEDSISWVENVVLGLLGEDFVFDHKIQISIATSEDEHLRTRSFSFQELRRRFHVE
jgi:hypothetical protein